MFSLKEVAKMRTICRKCLRPVIVIDWGYNNVEYRCDKCGYSTIKLDKVDRIKELKEDKTIQKDKK